MPTISDLTNTTWRLNFSITTAPIPEGDDYIEFGINFVYDDVSCSLIAFGLDDLPTFWGASPDIVISNDEGCMALFSQSDGIYWKDSNGDEYYTEQETANLRTITITGGTDATNSTLISWLQQNATLVSGGNSSGGQSQSSYLNNLSLGSLKISKMFIGNNDVSKIYYGSTLVYEKQSSGGGGHGTNDKYWRINISIEFTASSLNSSTIVPDEPPDSSDVNGILDCEEMPLSSFRILKQSDGGHTLTFPDELNINGNTYYFGNAIIDGDCMVDTDEYDYNQVIYNIASDIQIVLIYYYEEAIFNPIII